MEPQSFFNLLIGIAGGLGVWALKVIWEQIQKARTDIHELDTKMHEDFVRRDDFKEAITGLREDMKEGFKETKDLIGLLFKKVENKVDK